MEPDDAAGRGRTLTEALAIRDLPESGLAFDEALSAEVLARWLGAAVTRGPIRFTPAGAGRARLVVRPLSPEEPPPVRVEGRAQIALDTACVRCLEEVRVEVDAPVEASLFPDAPPPAPAPTRGPGKAIEVEGGEPLEPWGESFPDPDRLDEGSYDGLEVPLPELVTQALLIEVPTDPVCTDEPGCDVRTARLIHEANAEARARDAEGDPRWAALRALRAAASTDRGDGDPSGNR